MSKKILVCDDEPDLVQVVRTILQAKGYEILVAHDGAEALQKVALDKPDLLLIDLLMPKISGLEVVRRLQRDAATRDLPIIVMSAAGRDSGKSEHYFREGLGIDDYVAKPFDPLNLLGRVEAVLRMRDYQTQDQEPAPGKSASAKPAPKKPPSANPPRAKPPPAQSDPAEPAPRSASAPARKESVHEELSTFGPAEIVQAYVESWNTQNFPVEYACLHPSMTGNLPRKSYVHRRQQAFADDKGHEREQRVKRVIDMEADDDSARVLVEREDTVRGRPRTRQEEYQLVRGEWNWQITSVRPVVG